MSDGTDIEDKLNRLRDELEATGEDIDNRSRARDTLKADINYLQKIESDINQAVSAYNKAYENIAGDKKVLDDYAVELNNAINHFPDSVEKKVKEIEGEIDGPISEIEKKLGESNERYKDVKTSYDIANNNVGIQQSSVDSLKAYQKKVDDDLKNLKTLKDLIAKALGENNVLEVYFRSKEFNSKVGFELKTKKKFEDDLKGEWAGLSEAKKNFRLAETKERSAKNERDKIQEEYDKQKGSRNKDILDKIKTEEEQ